MLNVQNLTVRYGGSAALDGAGFTLREGERLMVVGPNGAGKSSLVAALTGGVARTGSALFEGAELSRMRPKKRARLVGTLLQNHSVAYNYSVGEIVRLGLYSCGDLRDPDAALADALAAASLALGLRRKANFSLDGKRRL